jgi:ketosteroid isomerase-like protein
MQAINNGDINTALTYYSNDATLLPPDLDIIQGSNGIGNFWTKITSMGLKFDTLTVAEVRPSDDGQEVHEIGRYFLKMERPGQAPVSEKGKFLFVWKKQPDNSWKIDTHMWNRSRQ